MAFSRDLGLRGAVVGFRQPVGVDIVPEHPPGKFGVLIGVLSLSSSTEAGGVRVPETFRVGQLPVLPRDKLDRKKELELLSFDKRCYFGHL